uniref:Uncharacterized protein n=1 Tax=Oryza punctata TaxID=4537 RepID=A0A0E0K9C3_ORYPU
MERPQCPTDRAPSANVVLGPSDEMRPLKSRQQYKEEIQKHVWPTVTTDIRTGQAKQPSNRRYRRGDFSGVGVVALG